MKISVVIPMYNAEKTIINTLESIRLQTEIKNIIEIIIINDGSTDNSLKVIEAYLGDRVFPIPLKIIDKKNGGVSSARNLGMKLSKGDWIALLDSDDEWLKEKTQKQIEIIKSNPDIDFLGGREYPGDLKILWRKIDKLYKASIKDLCIKMFPQPSTVIFKKDIYENIGGFDESQSHSEDANYFMKICSKYNYYYHPLQVVNYGGGKAFGVVGLSSNIKAMYEGSIKNVKELKDDLIISMEFYCFLRIFYLAKYLRRILITQINRWRMK